MTEDLTADARGTVVQVISIFVDDRLKASPLPEGFWDDDYVLGFLMCCAIQMTQARFGDALEPLVAADAAFDVIAAESGREVDTVKERVGVLQNTGSADYLQGMKLADKLVRYISGSATAALDPVVLNARDQLRQLYEDGSLDRDKVPEEAALRGLLVANLFTNVVRQRFDMSADA